MVVNEGIVHIVTQEFLDESDIPLSAKAGYPKVSLVDGKDSVYSTVATPSLIPGEWVANIAIPAMGLTEEKSFYIKWIFRTLDGDIHRYKEQLGVQPNTDNTRDSDLVALVGDTELSILLPVNTSSATYQIYDNNVGLFPVNQPIGVTPNGSRSSKAIIPIDPIMAPSLQGRLVIIKVGNQQFSYRLWLITPQLYLTMAAIEAFLNKSRIDNVIPELRYSNGDLVGYMERGLYQFNSLAYPTSFTGTNMLGILYDAHVQCSCFFALQAQLIAESSLSFDFSGQGISFNVDRSPALEAALGRIESYRDSIIIPLKKQLYQNAITSGDGSVGGHGGSLRNAGSRGMLALSNMATTRLSRPSIGGQRFLR